MPILAAEPDVYPTDLLDWDQLGQPADDGAPCWWAMYTLSRQEKQFMRRLRAMDVAHYGPLIARRIRSPAGRVRTAYVPLFPSYVFVYGTAENRYQALTTNCVSRVLRVPDGLELTRDLRRVRRLIESGAPLTPEARLMPGMRVRVRSGPFIDMEGVVIRRHGQDRLLVAVNFLKQGVSVLLDDYRLERIDW